jgi:hypothetical protein
LTRAMSIKKRIREIRDLGRQAEMTTAVICG